MIKLIITADDFGMCDYVNQAIIDCINVGVIRSTNVMTNMDCADAAKELKSFGEQITVGLHWTLTTGKPVLLPDEIRSIVDGKGNFLDAKTLRSRLRKRKVDKYHLKKEMIAQYRKFVDIYGKPVYWNTHENIHLNVFLFKFFVDLAAELGIYKMRCHDRIYVSGSNGTNVRNDPIRIVKKIIIKQWNRYARKKGMRMPDGLLVFAKQSDIYSIRDFYSSICWNKEGGIFEMYVHPATSGYCEYFGNITEDRVKEYKMCNDEELVELLKQADIQISHFGDV